MNCDRDCFNCPDHPVIRNMERFGDPCGRELTDDYTCPICGGELHDRDRVYVEHYGSAIGCNNCLAMDEFTRLDGEIVCVGDFADRGGAGEQPPVNCPVCGELVYDLFYNPQDASEIYGCPHCVGTVAAWAYYAD